MSVDVGAVIACALAAGALAAAGPAVIGRIPEPAPDEPDETASAAEPEAEPAPDAPVETAPDETAPDEDETAPDEDAPDERDETAAHDEADRVGGAPPAEPKTPYAELAARPRLAVWLALAGAAVGALVGGSLGFTPIAAAWVFLAAVGVVLAYVDWQTRLLPTWVIGPSYAVLAALILMAAVADDDLGGLARSAYGWLAFGGFYFVLWFIYPRGLGYGDVRLSGLLGLALGYLGWGEVVTGIYAGFLIGGVGGALLAALRLFDRKHFPFGPFMLLGALAGLLWGGAFADWYAGR